jgi:hypothetical protein
MKLIERLKSFYRRGAEERTQVHLFLGFVIIPLVVLLPFCVMVFLATP